MNKWILALTLAVVACSGPRGDKGDSVVGPQGASGQDGGSCHVEDGMYGAIIVCDDGSSQDIFDGKDGKSIKGDQGIQGVRGEIGPQGIPGVGCTVESFVGGAEIVCGNSSAVVSNGIDGAAGSDGIDAASVVIIDPCPTISTQYPELILKVGDSYMAYFQNGVQEFLTTLETGVLYQTTDARKCTFTL